jgi:hypothetical protein
VMSTKPRERTRPELLADLADAINELVEPRHHTEMLIKTVIESIDANGGRRRKAKRTRQRQRHTVTLPALLESLRSASVPGSSENGTGSGSFESRPAAELEALGDACPACLRRNCLTITGDLEQAVCGRCGTEWGHDTIGQLAELLRVNQTQPTAVAVRCVWPTCPHTGPHDVHQDGAGRTFRDRCAVPVVMEG